MKKIFTSLLILMLAVMAANAQSLSIAGHSINYTTSKTYTSKDFSEIKSGSVEWNATSKTLRLKDVTIETDKSVCIYGSNLGSSSSDRHFIYVSGNAILKCAQAMCMRFDNSYIVIYGGDTSHLSLEANGPTGYPAVDVEGSFLSFWSIGLRIMSANTDGIWGNSTAGRLEFVGTYADITGKTAAVSGFSSITFDDCVMYPYTNKVVKGTGITYSNGTICTSATIRPNLRVAGVSVRTESNTTSGTNWKWNKSSKTLTITGDITASGNTEVVENYGIDDLVIKWEGTPTLKNGDVSSGSIISTEKNVTLSGNGATIADALNLTGFLGIYTRYTNNKLTFDNACVLINGASYGIVSQNTNTDLVINNSALIVKGEKNGCIAKMKSCTMKGCEVYTAASPGVAWRQNLHGFGTTTELLKGDNQLWILKPTTSFNLKVLGKEVNDANMFDIQVDGLTAGKMSYDKDSKTLTLEDVNLEAPEGNNEYGLFFTAFAHQDFTINLTGENTFTTNNDAIYTATGRKLTFTGEGSAHFTSKNRAALVDNSGGTTVLDTKNYIRFEGKEYGFWSSSTITQEMILKKSASDTFVYRFKGGIESMHDVFKLTMDGMDFYSGGPSNLKGCYYDEEARTIKQNGGKVANDWVAIGSVQEEYPVIVAGKRLNNKNFRGLGSKYITSSNPTAVTYEATNTLTLSNAEISYTEPVKEFDALKIDGTGDVTINLIGNNTINTTGWVGLESANSGTTSVRGTGSLSVNSSAWYGVRIDFNSTLDIGGNVTLDAVGRTCGIANNNDGKNGETLVIREKAKVSAKGTNASVTRLNEIRMEDDIMILEPAGATIQKDEIGWSVFLNGDITDKKVVFGDKSLSAIEALQIEQNADVKAVYDAAGRQSQTVRQGLNIVRMSDGTVRKLMVK